MCEDDFREFECHDWSVSAQYWHLMDKPWWQRQWWIVLPLAILPLTIGFLLMIPCYFYWDELVDFKGDKI